jgi:hypothetical protein
MVLLGVFSNFVPFGKYVAAAAPGLAFLWIAWEWWRYLEQLDELARRMQMEAMAFAYVAGVFVMMALAGLGMAVNVHLSPGLFILMEGVRVWRLLVLARRYE